MPRYPLALVLVLLLTAFAVPVAPPRASDARSEALAGRSDQLLVGYLLDMTAAGGIGAALTELHRLARIDPALPKIQHDTAHAVGLYAGYAGLLSPQAVTECLTDLSEGCLHGLVIGHARAVSRAGRGVALDDLCESTFRLSAQDDLRRCWHALGHVAVERAGDLAAALRECDAVPGEPGDGCSSGVFMVLTLAAIEAERLGRVQTYFDPQDPLRPCTSVLERYAVMCYAWQSGVYAHWSAGDLEVAARMCERIPLPRGRDACLEELPSSDKR